jgi:hypothetical protein
MEGYEMYITIKKSNNIDEKSIEAWFPVAEEKFSKICEELGIIVSTNANCYIVDSNDSDLIGVIKERYCNIDELNFLVKRLDSFDAKEKNTFFASAVATDAQSLKDLINLTYNTHCYSVISDFSNLNAVGRDVYLNEVGAATTKELEAIDGRAVVDELMKFSPMKVVTPYGVLYQNRNQPEQVYDGRHFPCYYWQSEIATLCLEAHGDQEFIYMPCPSSSIEKALIRLEVKDIEECKLSFESDMLPNRLIEFISNDESMAAKVNRLNDFSKRFKEMGGHESQYFEKLMAYIRPRNLYEINALLDHMHEFQLFDGIRSAEEYGRFMICDSGHFEYDENLEDYIDFKRYGEQRMNNECGAMTHNGYITFYGSSMKLQDVLLENLGMTIQNTDRVHQMKLYMPLKAVTYDVENDYGYMEKSYDSEEISSHELTKYEEEILKAIEKRRLPGEEQRGMMKYYSKCDSVNAKVSKYEFTVEEIGGDLMGVAVLTLNDDLTDQELELIKNEISGQASDGYGEGFEQNEIQTEDRAIYVSFWNHENWSIKTAEELGLSDHTFVMKGLGI